MHRLAAAVLFAASSAFAHDLWLAPADFTPDANSPLAIRVMIAASYPGEEMPRQEKKIERFELVPLTGGSAATPIIGRDGGTPAGLTRIAAPGGYAIVYDSAPSSVELDAAKFESYLRDVGLEKIIERRAAAGASGDAARERFSRCAKALVRVGEAGGSDRAMGMKLELVAQTDPYAAGSTRFDAILLLDGKPLAGALVTASRTAGGADRLEARTNAEGRVGFELPSPGVWNLNAVDMAEADPATGADWESVWASLSFEWTPAR